MAIIHGKHGQHAVDLLERGILTAEPTGEHIVAVPITRTNGLLLDLLEHDRINQDKIVNLAGVMTTSPNAVPNLHFLFGPGGKTNLKVAHAGSTTQLIRDILDRSEQCGIEVVATTRTEHDKIMGIVQGLAHLFIVVCGNDQNPEFRSELILPWKTPTGTIVDMIFANSFAEEIAIEFFESLPTHTHAPKSTFDTIVEKHLKGSMRKNFSTPNFERIMNFTGDIQPIRREDIENIRHKLNTEGRHFLRNQIEKIRKTPQIN